MVIKSVNLETVCGVTSTLPVNDKPEFAFAGKSNVGKSSLINALMNRRPTLVPQPSPARPRPSTSTTSTMLCTTWIFRVTDMQKYPRQKKRSGER